MISILVVLCSVLPGNGQDIKMSGRKFLTFNQSRLTFGLGALVETTNGYHVTTSFMKSDNEKEKKLVFGGNIGLNLYSPNSIVDFSANFIYASCSNKMVIKITGTGYDYISYNRMEMPVFIRLKTGRITEKSSILFLLGGSYSMYTKSYSLARKMDNSLNNHLSIKTGLVTEIQFFDGKISRGNIELIYTHPLGDSFSKSYLEFYQTNAQSDNKINFGMVSLGLNYYFGR